MKSSVGFIIFLSLHVFLSLPYPSLSAHAKCNSNDKKVLLEIKAAFNNPYHLASWNPDVDCCGWYALNCDRNTGRVIELTIFAGNISGQIPPAVGDLPYLQNLMFHKLTNLTGPIPPAISKLIRLTQLTISWTNISGSVPSFLSQLKNLTLLDLSFNYGLTGSLPPSLSNLPNLRGIDLSRNKLTGSIPDSWGKFAGDDFYLVLSHNMLSGPILKSLGNVKFTKVDLSRNMLEGDPSFLFGKSQTVQIVDLSRNLFQFDFSKVEFTSNLTSLDLNHNKIFGSLPDGLTGLNLQFFNVSYNRLCGQIPQGGKLQSFDIYSYYHNRCLCGNPLPACKKFLRSLLEGGY